MAHLHDSVLTAVQAVYFKADDVAQVYSDDDTQWWVLDKQHNTFAYAWYEDDVLKTRPYIP